MRAAKSLGQPQSALTRKAHVHYCEVCSECHGTFCRLHVLPYDPSITIMLSVRWKNRFINSDVLYPVDFYLWLLDIFMPFFALFLRRLSLIIRIVRRYFWFALFPFQPVYFILQLLILVAKFWFDWANCSTVLRSCKINSLIASLCNIGGVDPERYLIIISCGLMDSEKKRMVCELHVLMNLLGHVDDPQTT